MNFDDAYKALVELAASRHNAFHTSEAAELHVSTQRLRRGRSRGELISLEPKVWALTSLPTSNAQRLRAATLSITGSAASLMSAAWLHGWIDTPPKVPQVWHAGGVGNRRSNVSAHKCDRIHPSRDITEVGHIRTLNKAATLCLLGKVADQRLVERCLDEFLRTDSETWLDTTMTRLESNFCPGFRCLVDVRESAHRVGGVPESWLERAVSKLTRADWLPPLVFQHPVTVEGRTFRLDLACPDLMLGVEAHSRSFHWGPRKEDSDNQRDVLLSSAGWQVLYVTHSQVLDPDEFIRLFELTALTRTKRFL